MNLKDLNIEVKCTELDNVLEAFKIANNAIYLNDRNDYLRALYDVCKAINPDLNKDEIGKVYID